MGGSGFPPLLLGSPLLQGYRLLLQDFPLCHPDSLRQGAQKGCLVGLGLLVLLLHLVVPTLLPWLSQQMKTGGPSRVVVRGS